MYLSLGQALYAERHHYNIILQFVHRISFSRSDQYIVLITKFEQCGIPGAYILYLGNFVKKLLVHHLTKN